MTAEADAVNYVLRAWEAVLSFFREYAQAAYNDINSQVSAMRRLRR